MRASEFITEAPPRKYDQDTIDLVKMSWDDGMSAPEISSDLGLSKNTVYDILARYHPTRERKVLHLALALTDEDKKDMAAEFLNNKTATDISKIYGISQTGTAKIIKSIIGVDRYNDEMAQRRSSSNVRVNKKITPEIMAKIKELYVTGKTLDDISIHFDNLIEPGNVRRAMLRQPDYDELRAKRDERLRKINTGGVATTKIHRPGVIDPQGVHGPSSRHRSGVDWQKLN